MQGLLQRGSLLALQKPRAPHRSQGQGPRDPKLHCRHLATSLRSLCGPPGQRDHPPTCSPEAEASLRFFPGEESIFPFPQGFY